MLLILLFLHPRRKFWLHHWTQVVWGQARDQIWVNEMLKLIKDKLIDVSLCSSGGIKKFALEGATMLEKNMGGSI